MSVHHFNGAPSEASKKRGRVIEWETCKRCKTRVNVQSMKRHMSMCWRVPLAHVIKARLDADPTLSIPKLRCEYRTSSDTLYRRMAAAGYKESEYRRRPSSKPVARNQPPVVYRGQKCSKAAGGCELVFSHPAVKQSKINPLLCTWCAGDVDEDTEEYKSEVTVNVMDCQRPVMNLPRIK